MNRRVRPAVLGRAWTRAEPLLLIAAALVLASELINHVNGHPLRAVTAGVVVVLLAVAPLARAAWRDRRWAAELAEAEEFDHEDR